MPFLFSNFWFYFVLVLYIHVKKSGGKNVILYERKKSIYAVVKRLRKIFLALLYIKSLIKQAFFLSKIWMLWKKLSIKFNGAAFHFVNIYMISPTPPSCGRARLPAAGCVQWICTFFEFTGHPHVRLFSHWSYEVIPTWEFGPIWFTNYHITTLISLGFLGPSTVTTIHSLIIIPSKIK